MQLDRGSHEAIVLIGVEPRRLGGEGRRGEPQGHGGNRGQGTMRATLDLQGRGAMGAWRSGLGGTGEGSHDPMVRRGRSLHTLQLNYCKKP